MQKYCESETRLCNFTIDLHRLIIFLVPDHCSIFDISHQIGAPAIDLLFLDGIDVTGLIDRADGITTII